MNKMNPIRLLTAVYILLMLALPLSAQEKGDSVITFRFLSGKDMFFSPGMNNGEELAKLLDFVGRNKELIVGGKLPLYVDGYCVSKGSKAENLAVARTRSNRVKSELITRRGLTEECFITHNHVKNGDFVIVRINIPQGGIGSLSLPENEENSDNHSEKEPETESSAIEFIATDNSTNDASSAPWDQSLSNQHNEDIETNLNNSTKRIYNRLALKTNLLDYAILMPNLEIEWMFANRWSAALEGQGAWYAKNTPHKVYRIATVIPEIRFWTIERSRWHGMYVGIFAGAGMFDLSNGKVGSKGHEGEGVMAGVSAGYMWPVSKHLSLDAGLGVGYMRLRDKEYAPSDGHFLYQLTKNINYFGPLRLKLSLVWRIPM